MAEIVVIVTLIAVFIRKVDQISLLHLEWGLVRLEFQAARKKTKRAIKSTKSQKVFRHVG